MEDFPTSDNGLECLCNLNGYAADYEAERWANVPLITDISVRIGEDNAPTPEAAKERYHQAIEMLGSNVVFGTYISGSRVDGALMQWPRPTVQWMPTWSYLKDYYRRIDVSRMEYAEMFAEIIAAECADRPGSLVFLDNIIHPSAMSEWPIDWVSTCRFLVLVRMGLQDYGKRLIVNVAGSPHAMSAIDRVYANYVADGFAFEMCYHESVRGDEEKTARLIETYRYWLDREKTIILIPGKSGDEREAEQQIVAEFAMSFREPGDRLFVTRAFWERQREWNSWPVDKREPGQDKPPLEK